MSETSGSRPVSGFLSDAWLAALRARVRSAQRRHFDDDGGHDALRLGIRITAVPWAADAQFAYTVVIAQNVEVVVGSDEEVDVVLVGTYEAARDLAEGRRTAGDLLEAGSLKVVGDVARLLSAGEVLSMLSGRGERGAGDGGQKPAATASGADPEG